MENSASVEQQWKTVETVQAWSLAAVENTANVKHGSSGKQCKRGAWQQWKWQNALRDSRKVR